LGSISAKFAAFFLAFIFAFLCPNPAVSIRSLYR
jgi:hypothetical protein